VHKLFMFNLKKSNLIHMV